MSVIDRLNAVFDKLDASGVQCTTGSPEEDRDRAILQGLIAWEDEVTEVLAHFPGLYRSDNMLVDEQCGWHIAIVAS